MTMMIMMMIMMMIIMMLMMMMYASGLTDFETYLPHMCRHHVHNFSPLQMSAARYHINDGWRVPVTGYSY